MKHYNKHFLKTKVKSYSDEATDFHDKTCLIISISNIYTIIRY